MRLILSRPREQGTPVAKTPQTPQEDDDELAVGKGRPTPTRAEREAARKRPLVPNDRRAASKERRERLNAQRERARIGMANGEERFLPLRDGGCGGPEAEGAAPALESPPPARRRLPGGSPPDACCPAGALGGADGAAEALEAAPPPPPSPLPADPDARPPACPRRAAGGAGGAPEGPAPALPPAPPADPAAARPPPPARAPALRTYANT